MPPKRATTKPKAAAASPSRPAANLDETIDLEETDLVTELDMCVKKVEKIIFRLTELRRQLNGLKFKIRGGLIPSVYSLHIEMGYGPGPQGTYTCQFCEDWWSNLARETQHHEKTCPSKPKSPARRAPTSPTRSDRARPHTRRMCSIAV